MSTCGVELRDGPIVAMKLLFGGQVIQDYQNGVHPAVLRLLLMGDDLLLRGNYARELCFVLRFKQERLIVGIHAHHLLDGSHSRVKALGEKMKIRA